MTIEQNIFGQAKADFSKLENFGFVKENNCFIFEKKFANKDFKAVVKVDLSGKVIGDVYDVNTNETYFPLRVENMAPGYSEKIRQEYEKILQHIKKSCFSPAFFEGAQANRLAKAIIEKYGDEPDFPWEKYENYAIFRNKDTKKWYALIMDIAKDKLEDKAKGNIEVVNIKLDDEKIPELLGKKGFYPAYHMNKKYWITLALDGSLEDKLILKLLDESYRYTLPKRKAQKK